MQFKSVLLLAAVAAAVDPSAPSVGQQNRFRALPRGSNLAISPVDGAEFIAGQHFDISIELHNENGKADASDLTFTINGKPASDLFGASAKPYVSNYNSTYYKDTQARDAGKSTKFNVARLSWRNLALPASGDYNLEVKTGSEKVAATWTVKGSSTRKAKNAILFIGDGMAPTMISAARYLAKYTKFGKFAKGDGFLNIEKFDAMGKIATNGIDAIITDSANSAAAYTSGQKGWVNTLSVYADTSSSDSLDDPKVETLAEIIRRNRPGMCIGVVTTASVLDATPAAMFGHTRSRGQGQVLVDQALNGFRYLVNNGTGNVWTPGAEPMPWGPAVKPDVLLGGGGEWFIGDSPINGTNYYDQYAKSGYNVVYDKDGLTGVSSGPVLGIFTMGHMDTWYDREVEKVNLAINSASSPKNDGKSATNQPGLQQMTLKAIEIMEKKCADGYFLMSEAAAIDKSMHPMDYDRGLADLLEFDRTVQAVRALPSAKDTAILLTADHSQGFDVYGSVDLGYFRSASDSDAAGADGAGNSPASALAGQHIQQRQAVGVYQDAGWIDNVLDDQGLPTKFKDARFRFASGKVDMPAHVENYEFKTPAAGTNPLSRNPAVNNVNRKKNVTLGFHDTSLTSIYVADPTDAPKGGVPRPGNLPANSGSSVHTLQAVDLYCYGPGSYKCSGVHDNTEVFFILADILGLGDKADTQDPYTPGAPTYSQGCAPASSASAAPAASSNAAYVASSVAPAASTPSSSTPSAYVAPVVANTKPAPQNLYSGANAVAMTAAVAALVALAF